MNNNNGVFIDDCELLANVAASYSAAFCHPRTNNVYGNYFHVVSGSDTSRNPRSSLANGFPHIGGSKY